MLVRRARSKPTRSWWRRLLRAVAIAIALLIVSSWLMVLLLRFVPPPTSAFMLGHRLGAMTGDKPPSRVRYRWTPIADVSPQLPIALVAAEDQHFPDHHGFDVAAIQDALDDAEDGDRLRGASTITQQTAKNLFLWGGRSMFRKGLEAYFTVLIELTWPKRRVLEVYLNVAEFGDGIYGAAAAHEAALLAAVLPNPIRLKADRPSAYVLRRANWIERQVRQLGGPAYLER
jgi:monofunctional biosynthetic peptidoglycan transglycosylase